MLYNTPTSPNLTESRPQLNTGSAFEVCLESALRQLGANPKLTPSKPKAVAEQTQSGHREQTPISETDPESRCGVLSS